MGFPGVRGPDRYNAAVRRRFLSLLFNLVVPGSGLVLLGRRAKAVRATIEVVGFPQRFESLLSVYRVLEPLRRAGVRFEGALGG